MRNTRRTAAPPVVTFEDEQRRLAHQTLRQLFDSIDVTFPWQSPAEQVACALEILEDCPRIVSRLGSSLVRRPGRMQAEEGEDGDPERHAG